MLGKGWASEGLFDLRPTLGIARSRATVTLRLDLVPGQRNGFGANESKRD